MYREAVETQEYSAAPMVVVQGFFPWNYIRGTRIFLSYDGQTPGVHGTTLPLLDNLGRPRVVYSPPYLNH